MNQKLIFVPQKLGTEQALAGYFEVKVGSNPHGEKYESSEMILDYDKKKLIKTLSGGTGITTYSKATFKSMLSVPANTKSPLIGAEFNLRELMQNKHARIYYLRIANHRSLRAIIISPYPFAQIWQQQLDAIDDSIRSIVITDSRNEGCDS